METVFTISGAEPYEMSGLGDAGPPPTDVMCVQPIKPLVVTAGLAAVGGLGAGVFGIYKFGQRRVGAGFGSIAAAVGLWWLGGRLMTAAAKSFQACRGVGQ